MERDREKERAMHAHNERFECNQYKQALEKTKLMDSVSGLSCSTPQGRLVLIAGLADIR